MIAPTIQFGLETEIGISSDVEGEVDVVAESIALVRSATEPGVWMCWDYNCEDPHVDMRGFCVLRVITCLVRVLAKFMDAKPAHVHVRVFAVVVPAHHHARLGDAAHEGEGLRHIVNSHLHV